MIFLPCTNHKYYVRCDFEHDLCNFIREPSDMQWQFSTGRVQVGDTQLPLTDHTTRSPEGHFMHADPSTGASNVGKARIATPGEHWLKRFFKTN